MLYGRLCSPKLTDLVIFKPLAEKNGLVNLFFFSSAAM